MLTDIPATLIKNTRGKENLLLDNNVYNLARRKLKGISVWRCNKYNKRENYSFNCPVTIATKDGLLMVNPTQSYIHNHDPYSDREIQEMLFNENFDENSQKHAALIREIFGLEMGNSSHCE